MPLHGLADRPCWSCSRPDEPTACVSKLVALEETQAIRVSARERATSLTMFFLLEFFSVQDQFFISN